jgi:hypothetical protein
VFGLRRSPEQLNFAAIMGSGGMEYGALLIRGWEGYWAIQGMIEEALDYTTATQDAHLLSLSIERAKEIPGKFLTYARAKNRDRDGF